jgi:hypothetical protein
MGPDTHGYTVSLRCRLLPRKTGSWFLSSRADLEAWCPGAGYCTASESGLTSLGFDGSSVNGAS